MTDPAGRQGLAARLARWLLLIAGLACVGYLVHRVGSEAVLESVRTLSWRLAIVLCFPYVLTNTIDSLGWRMAFHRDQPPPFPALWGARLAGEAVNATTPTASVGGEPVKVLLVSRWAPAAQGLASVVLDKTTMVMGQGAFLVLGLAVGTLLVPISASMMKAMLILLGVEVLAVGGFVLFQIQGVAGLAGRLLARFGFSPTTERQETLDGLDRSLAGFYRRRPRRLAAAVLCHTLAYSLGSLEIYLVLNFLGIPVSLIAAFVIESFGSAVRFASFMVPASLGALEGGNMAIFHAFGLGGATGLSYTLIRRLREATWALIGYVCFAILSAQRRRPAPRRAVC